MFIFTYLGFFLFSNVVFVDVHDAVRAVGKCRLDHQTLSTIDVDSGRTCQAVFWLWYRVLDVSPQTSLSVMRAYFLFSVHRVSGINTFVLPHVFGRATEHAATHVCSLYAIVEARCRSRAFDSHDKYVAGVDDRFV